MKHGVKSTTNADQFVTAVKMVTLPANATLDTDMLKLTLLAMLIPPKSAVMITGVTISVLLTRTLAVNTDISKATDGSMDTAVMLTTTPTSLTTVLDNTLDVATLNTTAAKNLMNTKFVDMMRT